MMSLPLAFVRHENQYQLVALLGLLGEENLMVGTDGRWLGGPVPAILQHHPFLRVRSSDGKDLLGVDESGLLPPGASGGTPLFNGNTAAPELSVILEQLVKSDIQRQQTRQTVTVLDQQGLIEPWDIQVQVDEGVRKIDGLFRINEKRLNEAPAECLLTVRDCGGLALAYGQLLSMQHVQKLANLAEARRRAERALTADHGIISFANL